MILIVHTELSNKLFKYKTDDVILKHELYDLFDFLDDDYRQSMHVEADRIIELKLKIADSLFKTTRYQDELRLLEYASQEQTKQYNEKRNALLDEHIKSNYIVKSVIKYELNLSEVIYVYDLEKWKNIL